MTVSRLREEMSNDEFIRWSIFYGRKAQQQELAQKAAQRR